MHSIIISQKLLTDDDAVHRNVSIRYYKIKIIPPVSLLQTRPCEMLSVVLMRGSSTSLCKLQHNPCESHVIYGTNSDGFTK